MSMTFQTHPTTPALTHHSRCDSTNYFAQYGGMKYELLNLRGWVKMKQVICPLQNETPSVEFGLHTGTPAEGATVTSGPAPQLSLGRNLTGSNTYKMPADLYVYLPLETALDCPTYQAYMNVVLLVRVPLTVAKAVRVGLPARCSCQAG